MPDEVMLALVVSVVREAFAESPTPVGDAVDHHFRLASRMYELRGALEADGRLPRDV